MVNKMGIGGLGNKMDGTFVISLDRFHIGTLVDMSTANQKEGQCTVWIRPPRGGFNPKPIPLTGCLRAEIFERTLSTENEIIDYPEAIPKRIMIIPSTHGGRSWGLGLMKEYFDYNAKQIAESIRLAHLQTLAAREEAQQLSGGAKESLKQIREKEQELEKKPNTFMTDRKY